MGEILEIVPIKTKLKTVDNNIKLYVLSDMHLGSPQADLSTLKRL